MEERDSGERLSSERDYKGKLVTGKIKVVKKQLKAELCGFQFAGLYETEGLDMMTQSSAKSRQNFG